MLDVARHFFTVDEVKQHIDDTPGTQAAGVYTGIRVGWSALCANKELAYQFVDPMVRELAAMTPGKYIHIVGDEVEVLTHEQYVRFVERAQRIVNKYGKTMIGWAKLIMSPGPRTYVDMKYTPQSEPGLRWAGYIELRTAYDWDPATYSPGLTEDAIRLE